MAQIFLALSHTVSPEHSTMSCRIGHKGRKRANVCAHGMHSIFIVFHVPWARGGGGYGTQEWNTCPTRLPPPLQQGYNTYLSRLFGQ